MDREPHIAPLAYEIAPMPRRRPWMGGFALLAALVSLCGGVLYTSLGVFSAVQNGTRLVTVIFVVVGAVFLFCSWMLVRQGLSLLLWRRRDNDPSEAADGRSTRGGGCSCEDGTGNRS